MPLHKPIDDDLVGIDLEGNASQICCFMLCFLFHEIVYCSNTYHIIYNYLGFAVNY